MSLTARQEQVLRTVIEEKLVKRGVSLKGLDYGKIEEATHNSVRQVLTIKVGTGIRALHQLHFNASGIGQSNRAVR